MTETPDDTDFDDVLDDDDDAPDITELGDDPAYDPDDEDLKDIKGG